MNGTPNEQQITDALRGIADAGGPPDEAAAWAQVQRSIAADRTDQRRRRILLGGVGLAAAGAAAALVLVLGTGDGREAVEVGPADGSTTTTSTANDVVPVEPSTTSTSAPPVGGGLPTNPLAVVVQDEGGTSRLDLYDADTGALVTGGLAESVFSISDVSVLDDGTVVYTEELGDSSTVRIVPWDGSADPVTPYGLELDIRAGTFGPDGQVLYFVEQGVTRPEGRIGIVGGDGGDIRYLEWAEDEDDFFLTQGRIDDLELSPDGTRLVFTSSYEGEEIRVVDLDAASLSESTAIDAGVAPSWLGDGRIAFSSFCCYPEFTEPRTVQLTTVDGSSTTGLTTIEGVAVAAAGDRLAVATTDGRALVLDTFESDPRPIEVDGTAVDVGL